MSGRKQEGGSARQDRQTAKRDAAQRQGKVGLVNLGCARNLVDGQQILGSFQKRGYTIAAVEDADTVVVNTCAFVEDAKRESVDAIVDLLKLKAEGKIRRVLIAGCLAQRYQPQLTAEFKDADEVIGTLPLEQKNNPPAVLLTPRHYAYVKICESCYHHCKFCVIPRIKGPFASREPQAILREVSRLDRSGVKEINVIGQDITAYGIDLFGRKELPGLLRRICRGTKNIAWVRLLYAHPGHVTDELIDVIAAEPKICKYLDMPLQHINRRILKAMGRPADRLQTENLIRKLRERVPGMRLRTTFITGLPGETAAEFRELLEFMKETRFDRVGVFAYSREEGTPAAALSGQVPQKTKQQRAARLMALQQEISAENLRAFIGKTARVLVDEKAGENLWIGRTQYDAPEVDGVVTARLTPPSKTRAKIAVGDFIDVKMTDADAHDLTGDVI
ncbi:MAG: 30S ribosomal protein S12 methylthiotransferase RimO [Candidatus Omnitrophica bacterium]|nr:30S ribosomal protein S12 methylthiotransferase RimO [Candidatus Omnitrophota bacterium]